ncbi:MAG: hypothetical protein WDO15_29995 [Bacteroidota bacterium]
MRRIVRPRWVSVAICFVTKPDNFKLVKGMLKIVVDRLDEDSTHGMCDEIHTVLQK